MDLENNIEQAVKELAAKKSAGELGEKEAKQVWIELNLNGIIPYENFRNRVYYYSLKPTQQYTTLLEKNRDRNKVVYHFPELLQNVWWTPEEAKAQTPLTVEQLKDRVFKSGENFFHVGEMCIKNKIKNVIKDYVNLGLFREIETNAQRAYVPILESPYFCLLTEKFS